jgi:hypothetical protein
MPRETPRTDAPPAIGAVRVGCDRAEVPARVLGVAGPLHVDAAQGVPARWRRRPGAARAGAGSVGVERRRAREVVGDGTGQSVGEGDLIPGRVAPIFVLPCHWHSSVNVAPPGSVPMIGDPVPGPERTLTAVVVWYVPAAKPGTAHSAAVPAMLAGSASLASHRTPLRPDGARPSAERPCDFSSVASVLDTRIPVPIPCSGRRK